jgi:hypothetical protein
MQNRHFLFSKNLIISIKEIYTILIIYYLPENQRFNFSQPPF